MSGDASSRNTNKCIVSRDGELIHKIWIGESISGTTDQSIYEYIKAAFLLSTKKFTC